MWQILGEVEDESDAEINSVVAVEVFVSCATRPNLVQNW